VEDSSAQQENQHLLRKRTIEFFETSPQQSVIEEEEKQSADVIATMVVPSEHFASSPTPTQHHIHQIQKQYNY